jgi:hypothetical protein
MYPIYNVFKKIFYSNRANNNEVAHVVYSGFESESETEYESDSEIDSGSEVVDNDNDNDNDDNDNDNIDIDNIDIDIIDIDIDIMNNEYQHLTEHFDNMSTMLSNFACEVIITSIYGYNCILQYINSVFIKVTTYIVHNKIFKYLITNNMVKSNKYINYIIHIIEPFINQYIYKYNTTIYLFDSIGLLIEQDEYNETIHKYINIVVIKKCKQGQLIKVLNNENCEMLKCKGFDYFMNNYEFSKINMEIVNSPFIQIEIINNETKEHVVFPLKSTKNIICIENTNIPYFFFKYYFNNIDIKKFNKTLSNYTVNIMDNQIKCFELKKHETININRGGYTTI